MKLVWINLSLSSSSCIFQSLMASPDYILLPIYLLTLTCHIHWTSREALFNKVVGSSPPDHIHIQI